MNAFILQLGTCHQMNLKQRILSKVLECRVHIFEYVQINQFNPAYHMLLAYHNEAQAKKDGCGFWTIAKYGAEAVFWGESTVLTAAGGVNVLNGASAGSESITAGVNAQASLITAPDQGIFWSGLGQSGEDIADEWATNNDGVKPSQRLAESGINAPKFAENPGWWTNASIRFAEGASGSVRVLLGNSVSPESIWNQIELPALMANPNVDSITAINANTGEQTVIWSQ